MSEILYISFDLECLGGNPSNFPIINAGFVAYTANRKKLGELSVNFQPLHPDVDTIAWFNSTPELKLAYQKCTTDPLPPKDAMERIRDWIRHIGKGYKVSMVAYPTIYDGSLLYFYWFHFLGHPSGGRGPGFTMIDIRSYAAGKLGISVFEASKDKALAQYRPSKTDFPHTHTGLDDAEEQMHLFLNLLAL